MKGKIPGISKEKLTLEYWGEGLSIRDLAKRYGISNLTIWNRMEEFGIPRRTHGEAAQVVTSKIRPRGLVARKEKTERNKLKTTIRLKSALGERQRSHKPLFQLISHSAWERIRKIVYKLSGYKCWNCGSSGRRLNCHEIIVDGKFIGFLSLCHSCHGVVERNPNLIPLDETITLKEVLDFNK